MRFGRVETDSGFDPAGRPGMTKWLVIPGAAWPSPGVIPGPTRLHRGGTRNPLSSAVDDNGFPLSRE